MAAVIKQKVFFPNLDGLRFFCFLSVFFYHSFYTEYSYIKSAPVYKFVKFHLLANANLGVNFFFVLSGFLITFLLLQEKKNSHRIRIGNFYKKRVLRIWPMYFFCVFFGFVIFPLLKKLAGQVPNETANPWHFIFFISNFDGPPDSSVLGVLWSVAIEEQFYLVWPLFIMLCPLKHLPKVFTLIILGTFVFRAFHDNYLIHESHTLSCIGDMTVGACGAYLVVMGHAKEFMSRLSRTSIVVIYLLFIFIYFFRSPFLVFDLYIRIFERAIIAFVILAIILEQCYATKSFYKMSSFRSISKLGVITYGLYCLHFIGILIVLTISRKLHSNTATWEVMIGETLFAILITILIGKISFRYYESPFLRFKNRLQSDLG
jgi:peptidoglycan/LPS O-acetylase OafA/YrhL